MMNKLILLLILLTVTNLVQAQNLSICTGEYALCAASATVPTGKTMRIHGKTFREGMAVCPILSGQAVANLALMHGSCTAPKGKVWSLFGIPPLGSYPQAPDWTVQTAVARTFTIGSTATSGISNMWSFICDIQAQPVNKVKLASCYGPIMESPITSDHVKPGQLGITQAPIGATWPVGGNIPNK